MCPRIPFYICLRSGRLYFVKKVQNSCTLISTVSIVCGKWKGTLKMKENKRLSCHKIYVYDPAVKRGGGGSGEHCPPSQQFNILLSIFLNLTWTR